MEFKDIDLRDNEIYLKLYKTTDAIPEKNYVPAYYFKIHRLSDNKEVGFCDLRVGHNKSTYYGGNIGYEIYDEYRGNHYAGKACLLVFELAKEHNMDKIIITCNPDNFPSRKTCEYVGGKLLEIVNIPDWHPMYIDEGKTTTCRYEINL